MFPDDIREKLMQEYKYRIEMHAHTKPVSGCSEISPEEMVKIYSELNYDAIVITNHFIKPPLSEMSKEDFIKRFMSGYEETKKAAENKSLTVLLGAEIRFDENINDYLIYGIDENMLSEIYDWLKDGIEAFRKGYKMEKSVFVQAHPCRDGITPVSPELLDGMETFNLHPGHNSRVGMAAHLAYENNIKIRIAGSDFHHLNCGHEGMCAVRTKTLPKDSFELARILKNGEYVLEIGKDSIVLV